jgi:hypothetical protein
VRGPTQLVTTYLTLRITLLVRGTPKLIPIIVFWYPVFAPLDVSGLSCVIEACTTMLPYKLYSTTGPSLSAQISGLRLSVREHLLTLSIVLRMRCNVGHCPHRRLCHMLQFELNRHNQAQHRSLDGDQPASKLTQGQESSPVEFLQLLYFSLTQHLPPASACCCWKDCKRLPTGNSLLTPRY